MSASHEDLKRRSIRWRKLVEDLRGPDGEAPPALLVGSANQFPDPTEWLESLGLERAVRPCDTAKNSRWVEHVRSSLGPIATLRPRGDSDPAMRSMQEWIGAALSLEDGLSAFDLEVEIMRTSWWSSVIHELYHGNIRSTAGGKERKYDDF